VTVAQRAGDPINQGVTTALKYTPEVASAIGMGPEMIANPLPTLGKVINSGVSGAVGAGVGRYGAQKLGAGKDIQDLAEAGGGLIGSVAGFREPPARYGFKGVGVNVPGALRPVGAAAEAEAASLAEQLKAPPSTSEAAKPEIVQQSLTPAPSEGRPATWTNQRVIELAKQNNPDAIAQVKARKLTFPRSRYMTGEEMPSSPDYQSKNGVTRFDTEGKPVVEGESKPDYTNVLKARTAPGEHVAGTHYTGEGVRSTFKTPNSVFFV